APAGWSAQQSPELLPEQSEPSRCGHACHELSAGYWTAIQTVFPRKHVCWTPLLLPSGWHSWLHAPLPHWSVHRRPHLPAMKTALLWTKPAARFLPAGQRNDRRYAQSSARTAQTCLLLQHWSSVPDE